MLNPFNIFLNTSDRRKFTLFLLISSWLLCICTSADAQKKTPVDYVNPFIGASTSIEAAKDPGGLGKTFPGAATPFGMVQVSPNTITGGDNGSGYSYEHQTIEGFALTQMSGVGWYGDLGNFLVMPTTGALKTSSGREGNQLGYRSYYDKKSEMASPGYYSVQLTDHHIKAELTASPHCGMMRFTFPENNQSRIQIDLARRVGGTSVLQYIKVMDKYTIEGYMKCTPDGGGWGNGAGHANYTVYFYAQFNKPLLNYGTWSAKIPDTWSRKLNDVTSDKYQNAVANAEITKQQQEKQGKHIGFFTEFNTAKDEQVLIKAGISFVSIEGAKANLQTEIKNWDFEALHLQARALWSRALSKIKVEGGSEDEKHIFYTALYHTMIDPRSCQDVNGSYTGGDGKEHHANGFVRRTVFSGWDVFRSQMPLQTIINPNISGDLINSWINLAQENGIHYFDRWEILNAYSGCMVGNPAISVIADAYAKGIRNYDVVKAYEYAVNTANKYGNGMKGFSGPPYSISNTLEYAYSDWCLSKLAEGLGYKNDAAGYFEKSNAYKKVFDKEKRWFRPLNNQGDWESWPAEGRLKEWYGTVESNPYQQGWFVPQDIAGMSALMGGNQKVIADLTSFFGQTPERMLWNKYYNHANEVVHHVPFLFNRLGAPWLTQKWTREICRRAYRNSVEGLVGNEDVGQMSAWYVLAASGLHPVCPGDPRYEITSPVFNKISFNLESLDKKVVRKFTITAVGNSSQNIYIQKAFLNGKSYDKCYLNYGDIMKGGSLELVMGSKENRDWAKKAEP